MAGAERVFYLVHVSFVTFCQCVVEDNLEGDSGSFVSYFRTQSDSSFFTFFFCFSF